jgi:hypothetical protein
MVIASSFRFFLAASGAYVIILIARREHLEIEVRLQPRTQN